MIAEKRPMLTTPKWMIPKNKCQWYEQANESLLKKKYQCWEEDKTWMTPENKYQCQQQTNQLFLKTNINAENMKINDC